MSLPSEVAGATTRSAVSGARREKGATQHAALESQLKDDSQRIPVRILAGHLLARKCRRSGR